MYQMKNSLVYYQKCLNRGIYLYLFCKKLKFLCTFTANCGIIIPVSMNEGGINTINFVILSSVDSTSCAYCFKNKN